MKRLLEKYLLKKIRHNNREYKRYLFLRWLAEFVKDNNIETTSVVCGIAAYIYYEYNQLYDTLTDMFIVGNKVFIVTTRPGMWIGKSGETIEAIKKELNFDKNGQKISDYEIGIIEDIKGVRPEIRRYCRVFSDC